MNEKHYQERICSHCEKPFIPTGSRQDFCDDCRKSRRIEILAAWKKRDAERRRLKSMLPISPPPAPPVQIVRLPAHISPAVNQNFSQILRRMTHLEQRLGYIEHRLMIEEYNR